MSLNDYLIGIQHELNRANQAVNDQRWSIVLSALDQIVENANEAFDRAGALAGPDSRTGI